MKASLQTGIHYSTAKTILFFHKRQAKAYASFAISPLSKPEPNADLPRASYLPISTQDGTGQTAYRHIPIISSILFPNIRFGRSKYSPRRSGESVREGSTKDEI